MRDDVPAGWGHVVLVCAKCTKKVGGGFGPKGRTGLARLLRGLLPKGMARRQPVGVVETKCLGLCPKRRVVAVDTRRPGDWLLLAPGTPDDELAARLGFATRGVDEITPRY